MYKPKVLIVSPSYPYPEHKDGTSKIIANLLCKNPYYTSDIIYLDLFSETPSHFTPENRAFYKISGTPVKTMLTIFNWIFSANPYNVQKYTPYIKILTEKILSLETQYDVIHISTPFFTPIIHLLPEHIRSKTILFPIDSLTLYTKRRLACEPFGLNKLCLFYDYLKCRDFEKTNYAFSKKTVFVSPQDAFEVRLLNSKINSICIENGVDIDYFSPYISSIPPANSLVFTGNMSYAPNKDAALFLIKEIFPLVKAKISNLKVFIVGSSPDDELMSLQSDDVIVTGFVDDIRKFMSSSTLYISPLRFGSGMKNKVLEAMSMGLQVIGSQISFEGIEVRDKIDCIRINSLSPLDFSREIITSLANPGRVTHIGENARKKIIKSYSWDSIRKKYGQLYEHYSNI